MAMLILSTVAWENVWGQTILNVSNSSDFATAAQTIFSSPNQDYEVNINASFTMNGVVAPLQTGASNSVTIRGNGNTIDGNDQFRPFFVLQGNVTIENLTVQNARAAGGNGGNGGRGGGGGLGGGGALFVNQDANVTLENV